MSVAVYDNFGRLKIIRGIPGVIETTPYDGPAIDAFGRGRVSNPVTVFDNQFQYDLQPLLWETVVVAGGGVAHTATAPGATLSVSTGATDSAIMQTYQYFRYQPGKSQMVVMTALMGIGVANITKRIGQFDANDGLFFEVTGAGLRVVRRTSTSGSPVDNPYEQADWNIDTMDGNGPSGIDINLAMTQIFFIDYQWLGVGRVRFGFVVGGLLYYCHEVKNANVIALPYMRTANLPLSYTIHNTAGSAGASMLAVCQSVISEGGVEVERGYTFEAGNAGVEITGIGNTYLPLMSLRPATTFNSIANRQLFQFLHAHIFADAGSINWQLRYRATLTGPSFAAVDATYSGMELDVTASAVTGGIVVDSGYVPAGAGAAGEGSVSEEFVSKYPFCLDRAGAVRGWYTWCARKMAGAGTAIAAASAAWRENR